MRRIQIYSRDLFKHYVLLRFFGVCIHNKQIVCFECLGHFESCCIFFGSFLFFSDFYLLNISINKLNSEIFTAYFKPFFSVSFLKCDLSWWMGKCRKRSTEVSFNLAYWRANREKKGRVKSSKICCRQLYNSLYYLNRFVIEKLLT